MLARLDKAIIDCIASAPPAMREVIAGLQTLRGVAFVTATTMAVEIGSFSRFKSARQLMSYVGIVPSEHSTGGPGKSLRGHITKTGNAHLRHVVVEAAWAYRSRPAIGRALKKRVEGQSEETKDIAWKAQHRLNSRFVRLVSKGKSSQLAATAVARELLGFMWAIASRIEQEILGLPTQQAA